MLRRGLARAGDWLLALAVAAVALALAAPSGAIAARSDLLVVRVTLVVVVRLVAGLIGSAFPAAAWAVLAAAELRWTGAFVVELRDFAVAAALAAHAFGPAAATVCGVYGVLMLLVGAAAARAVPALDGASGGESDAGRARRRDHARLARDLDAARPARKPAARGTIHSTCAGRNAGHNSLGH